MNRADRRRAKRPTAKLPDDGEAMVVAAWQVGRAVGLSISSRSNPEEHRQVLMEPSVAREQARSLLAAADGADAARAAAASLTY